MNATLKDFEELLDSSWFVRVHHSYIINLSHLESDMNKDGGYVDMKKKIRFPYLNVRK